MVSNPNLENQSAREWFNVDAFANPAAFTIGNAPRTLPSTRGPGFAQLDLSVFRTFSFLERFKLEIRGEAFNALNRVNLINPTSVNLVNPNTTFSPNAQGVNTNSAFGTITSSYNARQLQLGMHLTW